MSEQSDNSNKRQPPHVGPFEIEFDAHNNAGVRISTMKENFRGRFALTKLGQRMTTVGSAMVAMPDIPGIRFRVMPKDRTIEIYDPLTDDPNLVNEVNRVMKNAMVAAGAPYGPVATRRQRFSADMFKTLLIELRNGMEAPKPACRVTKGEMPTRSQIDSLPGRQLHDPGNMGGRQCKYKDEVDAWEQRIDSFSA